MDRRIDNDYQDKRFLRNFPTKSEVFANDTNRHVYLAQDQKAHNLTV